MEAERVWLVHKDGFASAGLLKDPENPTPEGKVRVQLDSNGDIIEVTIKYFTKEPSRWAVVVVVAQLVERLLPILEVRVRI